VSAKIAGKLAADGRNGLPQTSLEGKGMETTIGRMAVLATMLALAGCSSMSDGTKYENDARTDTTTLAEMRMDEAGGPSAPARPEGLVNPVSRENASPPSSRALSDAGPNTPLGKQWIFTEVHGFEGTLPPPPTNASFLMARESGRVIGTTSCNPISGSFDISIVSGSLRFRNLENGSALCAGTNARTEEAVIQAMVATDSFRLDGNSLTLLSEGAVVATLTTP
jgi:heat shock protein HslJ